MRPDAAEPRLHFISDAHAAGSAHDRIDRLQVPGRENDLAAHARTRFGDEARHATPHSLDALYHVVDQSRVLRARAGIAALEPAPIVVGKRCDMHPVRCARAAGTSVLVWADVDE